MLTTLPCSMQKYMRCKGACLASVGVDQPAEVADNAPKHLVMRFRFTFKFLCFSSVCQEVFIP